MRDERDVCVVVGLLFVYLTLDDPEFLVGVFATFLLYGVVFGKCPRGLARLIFAALVPVVSVSLCLNSMVRFQMDVPRELCVFLVSLALSIHRPVSAVFVMSLGISWVAYAFWAEIAISLFWFPCLVAVGRIMWETLQEENLDRALRDKMRASLTVARTLDRIDALNKAVWERKDVNELVMEPATIALIRSEYMTERIANLQTEVVGMRFRNLVEWSDRWGCRLLGLHGDVFVFLCPSGASTAIEMLRFMMDRIQPCAGVVDQIRLPVSVTQHGLTIDLPRRTLDMLQVGELRLGSNVRHTLGITHQSIPIDDRDIPGPPMRQEDRSVFNHRLERQTDDLEVVQPLRPLDVHPMWVLVPFLYLLAMYLPLQASITVILTGPAALALWYYDHPEFVGIPVGIASTLAVGLSGGNFVGVVTMSLIPGAPSVVGIFAVATFMTHRDIVLVVLIAMAGYSAWCTNKRDRKFRTTRATVASLLHEEVRYGSQLENLWKARVPDLVNVETRDLDSWLTLRDMGRRIVAFCPTLPTGVHPQDHIIHSLTGGCWIISREVLGIDADGARTAMEERLGHNAIVEPCSPRVLVFGGDVLAMSVFGPTRAKP